jgi:Reverse transcriptase (RNA-dependent DNA polymerase)
MPSNRKIRTYPIDQSPLFKLKGKGQFLKIIGVEWEASRQLLSENQYKVFQNKKGRWIQEPIGWLRSVHDQIRCLLNRIETPDYLYSRKGRSYVDNAKQHVGWHPVIKTDIAKFYPSTTRDMVFKLFHDVFKCARDIASRLADICCFEQKQLPTGSPLSGVLAYLANQKMFDKIDELAVGSGCSHSVYVDDITLSGVAANKKLLQQVHSVIFKHGMSAKLDKARSYDACETKKVTGVILVGTEVRLPNSQYKKIADERRLLANCSNDEYESLEKKLKGRIQAARQIVPDISQ